MNYKHLFPTFRTRFNFVRERLRVLNATSQFEKGLNLGTGEGDYDAMVARYCKEVIACDINESDIRFAKALNKEVSNLSYRVEDALNLTFKDNTFDLLLSVEVIEHVGKPERMMQEVYRVLKPGGIAIITFPSVSFPFTYDPINWILSFFTKKRIPYGAYGFGHDYLVHRRDFRKWAETQHFEIIEEKSLAGFISGLTELYWPGILQKILKANSSNLSSDKTKKIHLRPSKKEPILAKLTDVLIFFDRLLFGWMHISVCKGFVLQKKQLIIDN